MGHQARQLQSVEVVWRPARFKSQPGPRSLAVSSALILVTSTDRRGAEIEGERLATELCRLGIESVVSALAPGQSASSINVPTIGDTPLGLATLRALRKRSSDFDVVIAFGSSTLPACAIALFGSRTPFLYRSIGDPRGWATSRLQKLRTATFLWRAWRVVTLWPGAESAMRELYRVPPSKLAAIPNARSDAEFAAPDDERVASARSSFGLTKDGLVVALVGALTAEKRIELALDALAELPEATMLLAGDGPEAEVLLEHVRRVDAIAERVLFLGPLDDVRPVFDASNVLLLTSRTEGMPGVLIEAGMSGLPVVATDVGAVRWLFDEGAVSGEVISTTASPSDVAYAVRCVAELGRRPVAGDSPCSWATVAAAWACELRRIPVSGSSSRGESAASPSVVQQ